MSALAISLACRMAIENVRSVEVTGSSKPPEKVLMPTTSPSRSPSVDVRPQPSTVPVSLLSCMRPVLCNMKYRLVFRSEPAAVLIELSERSSRRLLVTTSETTSP